MKIEIKILRYTDKAILKILLRDKAKLYNRRKEFSDRLGCPYKYTCRLNLILKLILN